MDAFARQAGVNPRTLSWWRSQLRGKLDVPSFVEVSAGGGRVAVAGGSTGCVTLTVGSVVMTLDGPPPAAWLAELAAACHVCLTRHASTSSRRGHARARAWTG